MASSGSEKRCPQPRTSKVHEKFSAPQWHAQASWSHLCSDGLQQLHSFYHTAWATPAIGPWGQASRSTLSKANAVSWCRWARTEVSLALLSYIFSMSRTFSKDMAMSLKHKACQPTAVNNIYFPAGGTLWSDATLAPKCAKWGRILAPF